MHNVSCPLEYFSGEAVGGISDTDIVNMGDDVTRPQGALKVRGALRGDVRDHHWLCVKEEVSAEDGKSQPLNSSLKSDISLFPVIMGHVTSSNARELLNDSTVP